MSQEIILFKIIYSNANALLCPNLFGPPQPTTIAGFLDLIRRGCEKDIPICFSQFSYIINNCKANYKGRYFPSRTANYSRDCKSAKKMQDPIPKIETSGEVYIILKTADEWDFLDEDEKKSCISALRGSIPFDTRLGGKGYISNITYNDFINIVNRKDVLKQLPSYGYIVVPRLDLVKTKMDLYRYSSNSVKFVEQDEVVVVKDIRSGGRKGVFSQGIVGFKALTKAVLGSNVISARDDDVPTALFEPAKSIIEYIPVARARRGMDKDIARFFIERKFIKNEYGTEDYYLDIVGKDKL